MMHTCRPAARGAAAAPRARQFDRLYAESEKSMRVMAIAIHPYITGVPHRIRYLEELYRHIAGKPGVVHWTGAQIADWFRTAVPAPV